MVNMRLMCNLSAWREEPVGSAVRSPHGAAVTIQSQASLGCLHLKGGESSTKTVEGSPGAAGNCWMRSDKKAWGPAGHAIGRRRMGCTQTTHEPSFSRRRRLICGKLRRGRLPVHSGNDEIKRPSTLLIARRNTTFDSKLERKAGVVSYASDGLSRWSPRGHSLL